MPGPDESTERSSVGPDEAQLRTLFLRATSDLRAPELGLRPSPKVVPIIVPEPTGDRRKARGPRRILGTGLAAVVGAAAAVAIIMGTGLGGGVQMQKGPGPGHPAVTAPVGSAILYQLASAIQTLPTPSQRYAVQVEQQTQGTTTFLKGSVVDSRTGDTWTYQRGAGVPSTLPMAPHFSLTESELQARYPTDPVQLRSALIAAAAAGESDMGTSASAQDLAVRQAIDTLWNPLVQPALRSALVTVIAQSPGVQVNSHATDSRGRKAVKISYDDASQGMRLSVYLDPTTGVVLESSEEPYTSTAQPGLSGRDVYLSQYWTNAPPTVNPLGH